MNEAKVKDLDHGPSSSAVLNTYHWLSQFKELGVKHLPIKPKTKHVLSRDYNNPTWSMNPAFWSQHSIGIGCITTQEFVDVDCDSAEAIYFAKRLLPPTLTFGRESKKQSHYLYLITSDYVKKTVFTRVMPVGLSKEAKKSFLETNMIIEFRAAKHMTVLPGSIHKSGEEIQWTDKDWQQRKPLEIAGGELYRRVQLVALSQIVIENDIWVEGQRQEVCKYLAGALCLAKFTEEESLLFFASLGEYLEEDLEDQKDREAYVKGTYRKHEQGEEIAGLGQTSTDKLRNELGIDPRVIDHIRSLLKIGIKNDEFSGMLLACSENGNIMGTMHNVQVILENHPDYKERIRFNEFHYDVYADTMPWKDTSALRPWRDSDDLHLLSWLQEKGFTSAKIELVQQAVEVVADKNTFNPVAEYLHSLEWDGVNRLDTWLKTYLGAADKEQYLGEAGRCFMIGAVARVLQPGCKFDTMLVFQGKQGIGKSRAVKALVPNEAWMSEHLAAKLDSVDSMQVLRGKWIIEQSELSAIRNSEVEQTKSFLSRGSDSYRKSFGRRSEDYQRHTVFIGTTNVINYLKDKTGNRRFWSLHCLLINVDAISRDRDLLWAEAVVRYQNGEKWWIEDKELLGLFEDNQQSRLEEDVLEYEVLKAANALHKKYNSDKSIFKEDNHVSVRNIMKYIGLDIKDQNRYNRSIPGYLTSNGWRAVGSRRIKAANVQWVRPFIPEDENKWLEQVGNETNKEVYRPSKDDVYKY